MIYDDPILGRVRRCGTCGEWWPDDSEFYYTPPASSHAIRQCRACISERKADRPTPKKPMTHGSVLDIAARKKREAERKKALRRDPVFGEKIRAREREAQRRFYERHGVTERARQRAYTDRLRGGPPTPGVGRPRIDDETAA